MHRFFTLAVILLSPICVRNSAGDEVVRFATDVQPILSSKCYSCHGFDPEHREADLRLDVFDSEDSNGASSIIDLADPNASSLIERVITDDPDLRMPPPHAGDALSDSDIEILRSWITQGAKYEQHWAFIAPKRPAIPPVSKPDLVRNPIDAFVLDDLESRGLALSPRANKRTLIRRMHLDLTGLPPSAKRLPHQSTDNLDHLIDELLDSPHFGERWGRIWLDAARYADSDGFEKDKPRWVWMYRDWVINAMNSDLPYDEFIVKQVAGDLIDVAGQDEYVATGFLRNSMINEEGGADPEQFRMEAIYDRMDAIGKSVLGITLQCAQCHTHKYDPLSQTEYYRMFSFLNNSYEGSIVAYTQADLKQCKEVASGIREVEKRLKQSMPDWQTRLDDWAASELAKPASEWRVVTPVLDGSGGQKHFALEDGSVLAAGYSPAQHTSKFTVETDATSIGAIRLEALNHSDLPLGGPGRSPYGTFALSEFKVSATPREKNAKSIPLHFSRSTATVSPSELPIQEGYYTKEHKDYVTGPVAFAHDGKNSTAWVGDQGPGRSNEPQEAVFELDEPVNSNTGFRLVFELVQQHGSDNNNDIWNHNLGRFRFAISADADIQATPAPIKVRKAIATPSALRSPEQQDQLFSYWRTTNADCSAANEEIESLWQQHPRGTSQLTMMERDKPRKTHRLDRGDFLSPKEEVTPGVPEFLHPLTTDSPSRIDFARWLVDRRSPTTARAVANRVWQAYFGQGLVTTPADFGVQTPPPSHPQLLDWLAMELMDNNWSLKHLHRLIVSSATYQQSSKVSAELLERDPTNRWLARGPRFRVDGEMVRDIMLSASGLLNPKMGGPSVYPPAPEFLFRQPASYGNKYWDHKEGSDRYRRAIYTFRFRSVPYPVLDVFDAPNGNVSCVRRSRANTPLQALATLNEQLFVECAKSLAKVAVTSTDNALPQISHDQQRLQQIALACLSREFDSHELAKLVTFLDKQRLRFTEKQLDAQQLAKGCELPDSVEVSEFAAWTMTCRVILNLDETITKE